MSGTTRRGIYGKEDLLFSENCCEDNSDAPSEYNSLDIDQNNIYLYNSYVHIMAEILNICISEEDFATLKESELISMAKKPVRDNDSCSSTNRAISWFTKCNCAMLTTWRKGKKRQEKDDGNKELLATLRSYGYGVCKATGFYKEAGEERGKENSFLVFNINGDAEAFFQRMFDLSTKYEQDCFLYKEAGEHTPAYLFKTNDTPDDFFGEKRKKRLGPLHIDSDSSDNYSRIGSSKFSFEEKPLN